MAAPTCHRMFFPPYYHHKWWEIVNLIDIKFVSVHISVMELHLTEGAEGYMTFKKQIKACPFIFYCEMCRLWWSQRYHSNRLGFHSLLFSVWFRSHNRRTFAERQIRDRRLWRSGLLCHEHLLWQLHRATQSPDRGFYQLFPVPSIRMQRCISLQRLHSLGLLGVQGRAADGQLGRSSNRLSRLPV